MLPPIVSVSRRTDIPAYYGEWFLNRLDQGFAYSFNPFNLKSKPKRISLKASKVGGFVFWSKDFSKFFPVLKRVREEGIPFYLNFTITGLSARFEPNVPELNNVLETAQKLADDFGFGIFNWRYDPIVLSNVTGINYHLEQFDKLSATLSKMTDRCYFSYMVPYKKVRSVIKHLQSDGITVQDISVDERLKLANELADMGTRRGLKMFSCCGDTLLSDKIQKARCIDIEVFKGLYPDHKFGEIGPNPTRKECGCTESKDLGIYDTCPHGCVYCYANTNKELAERRFEEHNPKGIALVPSYDGFIEETIDMVAKEKPIQLPLFDSHETETSLPTSYKPTRPEGFDVEKIFLAKGSLSSSERKKFVEGICALYPDATITECLDTSHNRISFDSDDVLDLHHKGKKTLVFGELKTAVRFSDETGNACPNYWHFSPYGFCPYGCKYCYLAGTPGVWFSPAVKIYVNLPEMLEEIDRVAHRINKPTAFYLGKLQDGLALDPLTAYSTVIVPFFAEHPHARMTLLTKSAHVERLVNLEHGGNTILSWSVNPPEISERFEENVPPVVERIKAMKRVADCGYHIRAVMMPIIPIEGWEKHYSVFTHRLLEEVPLKRLTLGGICIYPNAEALLERKMGENNPISSRIDNQTRKTSDARARYSAETRRNVYSFIISRP